MGCTISNENAEVLRTHFKCGTNVDLHSCIIAYKKKMTSDKSFTNSAFAELQSLTKEMYGEAISKELFDKVVTRVQKETKPNVNMSLDMALGMVANTRRETLQTLCEDHKNGKTSADPLFDFVKSYKQCQPGAEEDAEDGAEDDAEDIDDAPVEDEEEAPDEVEDAPETMESPDVLEDETATPATPARNRVRRRRRIYWG